MTTSGNLFLGRVCLLGILLWTQTIAYGYERETHEVISEVAASYSENLNNYDLLTGLGLSSPYDSLTSEGLQCHLFGTSTKMAIDWLKEGSYCEDDTFSAAFARYKNHFYDPKNTAHPGFGGILWPNSGIQSGLPAPDWAIDKGPNDGSGQWYSFSQGRQYFYDALTKPSDTERKANLARMFRTLGDVMHIVEDMAQPQHTRNDSHFIPGSAYEGYTDQLRADHKLTYTDPNWGPNWSPPSFPSRRQYFTDLAQFSNENFVTAGTNFKLLGGQAVAGANYTLPEPGAPTDVSVQSLVPPVSNDILAACGTSTPCVMTFYSTNQDVYNERASALSIFDQYVNLRPLSYEDVGGNSYQTDRVFTLNHYTFDSAIPFLIPRAVSYSAGLLDYFFRGKIDMVRVPDGKFAIENLGTESMTGDFALYYDAADGSRYPVQGATWSKTVSANGGQSDALTFTPPTSPAPATAGEYMLVFKGDMGEEKKGFNSKGEADSSIGAVAAKKVTFTCRSLSINMTDTTVPSVTSTNWVSGAVTYLYGSPLSSPRVYTVHYTRTTTISVGDIIVDTINETQDNGSANSAISPWSPRTGVNFSVVATNNVVAENLVPSYGSRGYYENAISPDPPTLNYGPPISFTPGGGYYLVNGSTPYFEYGNATSAWVYLPGLGSYTATPLPGYATAVALANASNKTLITLSDGTQIASFPYTYDPASGVLANYPINSTWSLQDGNGYLDLYTFDDHANSLVLSQTVSFPVPSDVCHP